MRIHNEYLCLEMGMWHTSCKRQAAKQPRGNNSCRQTHQLPKIAIAWSYWGCRWDSRGGGRREWGKGGSTHSQAVVLPLILLTRSSFYATQPVAQVAPVPHHPPSLLPLASPSACADGNQSATAGALASHLAPDFWLNVTTAAASSDAF